jgi:hypothetical protein
MANRILSGTGVLIHNEFYDASTNIPDLDIAPSGIEKGDVYTVSVAGTFFTTPVVAGDLLLANVDNATLESHWTVNAGGSGASELTDLTDVSSANVAAGNVLVGNGATYAGRALNASDVSDFDTEVSNNASVVANTAKDTNVSTDLSLGTITATTLDVNSSDGTNATLPEANTTNAGLLGSDKWDEIVANTAKLTNVSTDLSIGTTTATTLDINSSDGTNATIPAAIATTAAGLLTGSDKDKLDNVEALADVTDSTNVDAAGATMNTDSTLVGNSYFLDDDTMTADDDTKVVSQQSIVAYVSSEISAAIVSGMDYKGSYDAATNTPDLDTTPIAADIGDVYAVTVAGNFFTVVVEAGDLLIANQNTPTLEAHWDVVQANITAPSVKSLYESNADTNAFTDAEQSKLTNIEALADVTDETNVVSSLNGATLTSATVAGTDKVLVQDVDDSDNLKTVTAQSIANLSTSGIDDIVEDTTPQLGGTLDSNSKQIRWSKGSAVVAIAALVLGTDGNYFDITGTTSITSIATLAVGTVVKLHFDAALTLTHHATNLILPGEANITTAAGDEAEFIEYATGNWRCTNYSAIAGGGGGVDESLVFSYNLIF